MNTNNLALAALQSAKLKLTCVDTLNECEAAIAALVQPAPQAVQEPSADYAMGYDEGFNLAKEKT